MEYETDYEEILALQSQNFFKNFRTSAKIKYSEHGGRQNILEVFS